MALQHWTEETFQQAEEQGVTALVDFYADWCGPCKMLGPIVEQLAGEITDGTLIGKVNIDENPAVAQKFGVMSIPTVVVLKDGKEVARSVGFTSKDKLVSLLAQAK
ncbi:thioredoxin [Harryflintia acetispora]|uniref:Thioredoxin n=1 Tax=Harryflintia acetispora TaxID=1849041 RepID=A0A9X8UGF1_9FIRM|nr:thioredoxin [Harryflintia acetispora]TCL40848.1 thioredoxin [Harryflintia acetispora]